jgi:hypothetical protein
MRLDRPHRLRPVARARLPGCPAGTSVQSPLRFSAGGVCRLPELSRTATCPCGGSRPEIRGDHLGSQREGTNERENGNSESYATV